MDNDPEAVTMDYKRTDCVFEVSYIILFHIIIPMTWRLALCNNCKTRFAKIFQEDGDYCLECWQERTHPYLASEKNILT